MRVQLPGRLDANENIYFPDVILLMASRNARISKLKYKRRRGRKTGLRGPTGSMRSTDFYALMKEQKGLCANPKCAGNNDGVHQKVGSVDDMCFKIPPVLWEILGRSGDPRRRSNRQLLCRTCRKIKTSEDRKKISQMRKRQ